MPVGDPPNYTDMPQSLTEGRYPTRWELDALSPYYPVYIRGIWTPWNVPPSVSIANSIALRLAGIDRHTQPEDQHAGQGHSGRGFNHLRGGPRSNAYRRQAFGNQSRPASVAATASANQ